MIRLIKKFFEDFHLFRKNQETIAIKLGMLIDVFNKAGDTEKQFNELIAKHNELIHHMTQFFMTSEKIKIADDKRKKETEDDRKGTPEDLRF